MTDTLLVLSSIEIFAGVILITKPAVRPVVKKMKPEDAAPHGPHEFSIQFRALVGDGFDVLYHA
jgi:hypothetical protein